MNIMLYSIKALTTLIEIKVQETRKNTKHFLELVKIGYKFNTILYYIIYHILILLNNLNYNLVITSNIIRTLGGSDKRSPFGNVNNLLSSKTEFKFSTHSGSTSPSKIIHCLLLISPRTLSTIFLKFKHY